jgi:cobyrinic acid a,c-diamide synthase
MAALGAKRTLVKVQTPPGHSCDVAWLPGGYPELHVGKLAAASRFADSIRKFAQTRPVHGECGGYMTLGAGLIDAVGTRHADAEAARTRNRFCAAAPASRLQDRNAACGNSKSCRRKAVSATSDQAHTMKKRKKAAPQSITAPPLLGGTI